MIQSAVNDSPPEIQSQLRYIINDRLKSTKSTLTLCAYHCRVIVRVGLLGDLLHVAVCCLRGFDTFVFFSKHTNMDM